MAITLQRGSLIRFNNNELSEHNRSALETSVERFGKSVRTWNGTLRKYHIADKRSWSLSWEMLPGQTAKTVDGKWGAIALRDFYFATPGAFPMQIRNRDASLTTYTVVFTDFSMTVQKRWKGDDYYSVSCTVEEV